MASQNRLSASEDINGDKWDRCLTDTILKTGLNILFSIIIDHHDHYFSYRFGIGYCLFSCSLQT